MRYATSSLLVLLLTIAASGIAFSAQNSMTLNKVVAVVNGEMISAYDLERAASPEFAQQQIDPRNPAHAGRAQAIMQSTLESMIVDILVVQEAERLRVSATESDVDSELGIMIQRSRMPEDEFFRQLEMQGMNREQVRDRMRKRILQQRLMSNMVGRKVVVSKDEIAKYFAEHGNSIGTEDSVEFAIIVYPPNVNAEDWAKRIESGNISFENAVSQVSVGPARQNGGKLERMLLEEASPVIRPHLTRMSEGSVSAPFPLEGGVKAQVKLNRRIEGARITTLEEAAPIIEERLRGPRLEERYKDYLAELRKKARVDIRL